MFVAGPLECLHEVLLLVVPPVLHYLVGQCLVDLNNKCNTSRFA